MSIQAEACKPPGEWLILITLFVSWQLGYPSFYLILNIRNKNMSCFHIKEKSFKHYVYMKMKLEYPQSTAFLSEIFRGNKQENSGHTSILSFLITAFLMKPIFRTFYRNFLDNYPFHYNLNILDHTLLKTEFESTNILP